jgi:hypothetical protein
LANSNLTLADIEALGRQDCSIANFLRRLSVVDYDDFIDVLYDDILIAVERMEESPHLYIKEGEDATTQRLLDMLHAMSYSAHHDLQLGGSVDITIELGRRGLRWIGEAKRYKSVADMREGYLQLSTRYKPGRGSLTHVNAGLIGYVRRPNAAKCMETWRAHFLKSVETSSAMSECQRRGPLAFVSEHTHESIGIPFRVWHLCVSLHFDPKDKSGRTSKIHTI